jgi:integration host factor subunit beta
MTGSRRRIQTYTKRDIARRIARASSTSVAHVLPWLDSVLNELRSIMMNGDPELRIELRDFGVFEVKETKSKPKARNPQTGEVIFVPARKKTHFKPGKVLRTYLSRPISGGDGHGPEQPPSK